MLRCCWSKIQKLWGFFHWHKPSGRTMVLRSTQPLKKMISSNISWGKGCQCLWMTTLPPSLTDFFFRNLGASTFWNPQRLSRHVQVLLYLLQFAQTALSYPIRSLPWTGILFDKTLTDISLWYPQNEVLSTFYIWTRLSGGRTMVQAVSHRPLTAEALVRCLANLGTQQF